VLVVSFLDFGNRRVPLLQQAQKMRLAVLQRLQLEGGLFEENQDFAQLHQRIVESCCGIRRISLGAWADRKRTRSALPFPEDRYATAIL
jgi:hypothetical protein